jgi:glycosyltransferase involved in cell wall biosynthesis
LEKFGVTTKMIGDLPFEIDNSNQMLKTFPHDPLNILSVGRMVPAKGFHTIISALNQVQESTGLKFHLKIVSSMTFGSSVYLDQVQRLIADLDLESDVSLVLDIGNDELRLLYKDADLFLIDSAHEGLCVPVIEALKSDLRVVTSDRGNLPNLVSLPDLTVEHLNVDQFADAIVNRISNFSARQHKASQVVEYFSKENVQNLFEQLLNSP